MHTTGDNHLPPARPGTSHPPLRRRLAAKVLTAGIGLGLAVGSPGTAPAGAATSTGVTARVSVTSTGVQSVEDVTGRTVVDTTGRYVAFSGPHKYEPTDFNGFGDVYVRDRLAGTTTRVSLTDSEQSLQGGTGTLCGASGDLRFIGFWSDAANLPAGDTGQIYLRDRKKGTTRIVSLGAGGLASQAPGGGSGIVEGDRCDVSLDGRFVAFESRGNNIVADGNGNKDVFRRDLTAGTTVRVSVKDNEAEITGGDSGEPQISDDGDKIVFSTGASVSADDLNAKSDVFVRQISTQSTTALSRNGSGAHANGDSDEPVISADGSTVAFTSAATDLVPAEPDENGVVQDVYATPISGAGKSRISVSSTEVQSDAASSAPSLSATGRYVSFSSVGPELWPLDGNGELDVFVRDRQLGLTTLASRRVDSSATSALPSSSDSSISADGTAVSFSAEADDLVRDDTNDVIDAFVRDTDVDHKPFDSFDELVAQQFADFAGRAPTNAEATAWRTRLRHGEVSPDQVITSLAHSKAWSQRRGPVTRLYWAFFLRPPDEAGLDYWVAQNAAGKGLHTIAGQFAQSKEFKDTYGPLSNGAFVTLVYQNVLRRDPAPNEVAYWKGELDAGTTTRGSVMVGFSESAEGRRFLAPQVDVVLVHLGMLGTIPGKALHTELAIFLSGGEPLEMLAQQIRVGSSEYLARFD